MNRVFNSLTVRTIDEDQRVIEGVATTNRKDRVSDIVEPLGSEFDLPIPLLLDHVHSDAVGEVEAAEVTSTGIRFRARIKKIAEPGLARDLVDKAWHLVKYGLRKTCSIGFQPLEYEPLPDGGLRFTKWSWYELSICSVPANPDAIIETVKRGPKGRQLALHSKRGARGGSVVVDPAKRVRSLRRALVHMLGEKNVPRFWSLEAAEAFVAQKQADAKARGAVFLDPWAVLHAMPKEKHTVVRLDRSGRR